MYIVIYNTVDKEADDFPARFAGEILRLMKVKDSDDVEKIASEQLQNEVEDYFIHDVELLDEDFDQKYMIADDSLVLKAKRYTQDELRTLVNKERQKRLETGVTINGMRVAGRDDTIANLTSMAMSAQLLKSYGFERQMVFRDEDNIIHELTVDEMLDLWQKAAAAVEKIYANSWRLKDNGDIPQDFDDDKHWTM